jgi:UDP-2,3-diacylglucosamine pyrophosphatase LpxH
MAKRNVEIVVLSDVHLGTFGCHATELLGYLKQIQPEILILNGDIIDIWQFRKRYFPQAHLAIIKQIISLAVKGTKVYYLTGNHDEMLRKFSDFNLGNITLADKIILEIGGRKHWFFHGDIFDPSIQNAKWLAKLGGWGYDLLILMNRALNKLLALLGREKYSLSKRIKTSVKNAVKYISDFEKAACELAVDQGYDFVICGHIHQPELRVYHGDKGSCVYMNSGDWVENLTSLEYHNHKWEIKYCQRNTQDSEQPSVGNNPDGFMEILEAEALFSNISK